MYIQKKSTSTMSHIHSPPYLIPQIYNTITTAPTIAPTNPPAATLPAAPVNCGGATAVPVPLVWGRGIAPVGAVGMGTPGADLVSIARPADEERMIEDNMLFALSMGTAS